MKAQVFLIDVNTGIKKEYWLTKKQFESLPINLCLPYEYESRKELLKEVLK